MSTPFYSFASDNPVVPFASGQVSVSTTATLIGTFEGNQSGVLVSTTESIYLGGPNVTAGTGFPITSDATPITVPTNAGVNCELYAIADSTTATVSYLHAANGGSTNLG